MRRLLPHLHEEDGNLVEREERRGQQELADDVRRRHDGGDGEDGDNHIAALLPQPLRGHDARPPQKREQHGQLETKPEGEDKGSNKAEVFADPCLQLYRQAVGRVEGFKAREEFPRQWNDEVIDKGRPRQKQDGRRQQEGKKDRLLVLVKPGGYEKPHLRRDDGKRQERARETGELHIGDKGLAKAGVNQAAVFALQHHGKRVNEEAVNILREEIAGHAGRREEDEADDKPAAQLGQVIEQWHGIFVNLFSLLAHLSSSEV